MNKRSLLFVLALTFTLFFVNMYFESRQTDELKKWTEQQKVKKTEKLKSLTQEVASRTTDVNTLPIFRLYADDEGTEELAAGVGSDKSVLVLPWNKELPKVVYAKKVGSAEKATKLILATSNNNLDSVALYRADEKDALQVAALPEFGRYDLQLLSGRGPSEGNSPSVYLGEYVDGRFEIPALQIAQLKKDLGEATAKTLPSINDGIVLLKTAAGYVPAAVYHSARKELLPLEYFNSLTDFVTKPKEKTAVTANQKAAEKFFVLETPYQQLVFSNYGGALVEINLPFESKTDQESVVKEIEFDREMVEKYPYNAHFPSHAFSTPGNGKEALVEHSEGVLGGYYPLLRRDLIAKDKRQTVRVPPKFYALNIVSEYPEMAELVYELKSFDKESIVFEALQGHRRITKTFSVASESQAPYTLDLTVKIEGDGRGLWLTSGVPEVEWISGAPAPALKYRVTRNQKSSVENLDLPQETITVSSTALDWITNSNGFFGMIMDPLKETDAGYRVQFVPGTVVPSRLVEIDQEYQKYKPESMPGYMTLLPLRAAGGTMHFRVFAGPFAESVLKTVDKVYTNEVTGYNPDYIASQSFHGWFAFISEPFAKFLFILMKFFYSLTGSWAFSIILLTVALRIMLYPLNAWSTKSMVKMQQIAPQVTAIQERNKKDPRKAQVEIMNLYREKGVNPVSGCFPMLIQMPFLIGMFDLLKSTFELRGASFIPGWIDNLTAPDVLFSWTTPIYFIGNQFHLLPILLGIVMFVQQRYMSTAPKDPNLMTDQQRQQRFMGNIMAVVFTVMFYHFPAGLNIYWLSSMLLGMLQQYWTMIQMRKKAPEPVAVAKAKK